MRHKLTTFILKNPPAGSVTSKKGKKGKGAAAAAESSGKKDKYAEAEEMREAQLAGTTNIPTIGTNSTNNSTPNGELAVNGDDDISKGFANPAVANRKIDDDDWAVDTSAEAVAARMKNLAVNVDGFAGGLGEDDDEAAGDTKYTAFGTWLEESRETASDAEIAAKAKEMEVWGKHKTCVELGHKLWQGPADAVVDEVNKRIKVLQVMTTTEKAQKCLLGGIERYFGNDEPEAIPQGVPKVLMALYQADVLDEEIITQWGTHVSKKYVDKDVSKKVRKAAEPILKVSFVLINFVCQTRLQWTDLTIFFWLHSWQWLEEADESDSE